MKEFLKNWRMLSIIFGLLIFLYAYGSIYWF